MPKQKQPIRAGEVSNAVSIPARAQAALHSGGAVQTQWLIKQTFLAMWRIVLNYSSTLLTHSP